MSITRLRLTGGIGRINIWPMDHSKLGIRVRQTENSFDVGSGSIPRTVEVWKKTDDICCLVRIRRNNSKVLRISNPVIVRKRRTITDNRAQSLDFRIYASVNACAWGS